MKEKIKKFFTNKENLLIIYIVFMSIFGFFLSYLGGLAASNYNLNNTTVNIENKKLNDNISIKKANDNITRLNPNEYYNQYSKVGFNFDDNFIVGFYEALNNNPIINESYQLYCSSDDEIFLYVVFTEASPLYFDFELKINDNYFTMAVENNDMVDDSYMGIFNDELSGNSWYENLNELGVVINEFKEELGLNNFYLNITEYSNNIAYSDFTDYVYVYDIQSSNFLTEFLNSVADITLGVGGVLTQAVVGVGSILFFNDELTIVGFGLAMALGIGAVYLIFRMVRGLIKRNDRG